MTKRKRIVLGILSFWPIVYMIVFLIVMMTLVFTSSGQPTVIDPTSASGVAVFGGLGLLFALHIFTMVLTIVMIVIYFKQVHKNTSLSQDAKLPWYLMLIFLNMFAFPIYWYYYIRVQDQTPKEGLF